MDPKRVRLRIVGVVQGVGFRPFVHELATRFGLAGFVGNDSMGVFAEVEGDHAALGRFDEALVADLPPLARIDDVSTVSMAPLGATEFSIVSSVAGAAGTALISPDAATCDDCLAELADPSNRRYQYPFINCTNCGPRFTIVTGIPYDRPLTTMAGFEMCADCRSEYEDPSNRRFHAQPVCCFVCGPKLEFTDRDGNAEDDSDSVKRAVEELRAGRIIAVKGLGGYHLAVDATSETAVRTLRSRKVREDKPFAIMVGNIDAARAMCHVDGAAEELLTSRARPIVLLHRHPDAVVAPSVAPNNRELGVMLPYTPLHTLLMARFGGPMVMTSGNVSDEPIAYEDLDARIRLSAIADFYLTHDRPIHTRTDDSVARVQGAEPILLRRSRGHVPEPVELLITAPPMLGTGAELKNTFCLARGTQAFVSHHIGDLGNYETFRAFEAGVAHFERILEIEPEVVAYDLHPEYLSTKYALERQGVELIGVQHHHAHIASCMVDNGYTAPVIGVAFDGTGYGPDNTLWGGEFLVADLESFERVGHFSSMPLPGGVTAIRQPWRMAASYVAAAYGDPPADLGVYVRNAEQWSQVIRLIESDAPTPITSSVGRLFDAVAAALGVRDVINYEGQAAIELEQLADPSEGGTYEIEIADAADLVISGTALFRCAVDDLLSGTAASVVAARFHNALADAVGEVVSAIALKTGHGDAALSGGVFQNALLSKRVSERLVDRGITVLQHRNVPPNDGGISLGQVAVAAARRAVTAT